MGAEHERARHVSLLSLNIIQSLFDHTFRDYDNVLGSGAFAYVVQATLLGQGAEGAMRGVGKFNGNLVAVKILHSTVDEAAK